jgi:hypothetical protein
VAKEPPVPTSDFVITSFHVTLGLRLVVGKLHQELQSIPQARPNRIQLRPMPIGRQWSPSEQTRSVSLSPECGRPSPVQSPPLRSDPMRLVRLGIVDTY